MEKSRFEESWRQVHNLVSMLSGLGDLKQVLADAKEAHDWLTNAKDGDIAEANRVIQDAKSELANLSDKIDSAEMRLVAGKARVDEELAEYEFERKAAMTKACDEYDATTELLVVEQAALAEEQKVVQAELEQVRASAEEEKQKIRADLDEWRAKRDEIKQAARAMAEKME